MQITQIGKYGKPMVLISTNAGLRGGNVLSALGLKLFYKEDISGTVNLVAFKACFRRIACSSFCLDKCSFFPSESSKTLQSLFSCFHFIFRCRVV